MSGMGLDWYKREPAAYLRDTQGLSAKEHAVYSIVLDLIYAHGGAVKNDARWISGWISDMGAAAVRTAISSLIERGILELYGDEISQKRARSEVKTKGNQRETARKNGRIGGERSAKTRAAASKNKDLSEPCASSETQAEKRREEKKEEGKPSSKEKPSRLSRDWVLPSDWGEWALGQGWTDQAIRNEADKFRDYWISVSGQKGVKLDWKATWRNWIRNANPPKNQTPANWANLSEREKTLRSIGA